MAEIAALSRQLPLDCLLKKNSLVQVCLGHKKLCCPSQCCSIDLSKWMCAYMDVTVPTGGQVLGGQFGVTVVIPPPPVGQFGVMVVMPPPPGGQLEGTVTVVIPPPPGGQVGQFDPPGMVIVDVEVIVV